MQAAAQREAGLMTEAVIGMETGIAMKMIEQQETGDQAHHLLQGKAGHFNVAAASFLVFCTHDA